MLKTLATLALLVLAVAAQSRHQLGVVHYDLPGRVPVGNSNTSTAVLLHLFIKVIRAPDSLTLRGLGFALSLDEDVYGWNGADLSQSPAAIDWRPTFALHEVNVARPQTFRVAAADNRRYREHDKHDQPRLLMPIRFVIDATNTRAATYSLHVDGWDRYVWLDAAQDFVEAQLRSQQLVLSGMLPPMFDVDPSLAATIVARNADYHLKLGFHKVYVYCTKAMLAGYQAQAKLAALLASGRIELVLFDFLPQCQQRTGCYKPLTSAHAVLGLWGSGEHVTIADPDELLALPRGQTVAAFLRGHVAGTPLVRLQRVNVVCSSCPGREVDAWHSPAVSNPLQLYDMLTGYEPINAGKCVVDPGLVHGFAIHGGSVLGNGSTVELGQEHAFWIHLPNLFRQRVPRSAWSREFKEWQWPFESDTEL